MPRSHSRSHRSEKLHSVDACEIRGKDAAVANLVVQHISAPRLDAIEYSARRDYRSLCAELAALKERVEQLDRVLSVDTHDGAAPVLITGGPLVIR